MEILDRLKGYSPIILRLAISIVFFWFGISQIIDPASFIGYLPSIISTSHYATAFIIANGILEVMLATMLIIGLFTRIVSAILFLHLLGIIASIGYNDIAVRDFGLLMAILAIFLFGDDQWCLANWKKKNIA